MPYTAPLFFSSTAAALAANPNTNDNLVTAIKRRGMIPTTSDTFSSDDLLAFATEELRTYIQSFLLKMNEEYAITFDYYLPTTSAQAYRIPFRASGSAPREVRIDDGSGMRRLDRIEPERRADALVSGSVAGYMLDADSIVLLPTGITGTLQLTHAMRPSQLVLSSTCARIQAIGTPRTSITLTATAPANLTSGVALDIIAGQPPFRTLMADVVGSTIAGTAVTLSVAAPAEVSVGDYIALAGQTPIAQCPVECHPLLAQRTVVRVLEAKGDPKVQGAMATADRLALEILPLIGPRVKSDAARPIVNPFAPGFSRR